jgi:hypothetical protein
MPMLTELTSLAPDPVIWHGNGAGKTFGIKLGYSSFMCHINKYLNLDHEKKYIEMYGYN